MKKIWNRQPAGAHVKKSYEKSSGVGKKDMEKEKELHGSLDILLGGLYNSSRGCGGRCSNPPQHPPVTPPNTLPTPSPTPSQHPQAKVAGSRT